MKDGPLYPSPTPIDVFSEMRMPSLPWPISISLLCCFSIICSIIFNKDLIPYSASSARRMKIEIMIKQQHNTSNNLKLSATLLAESENRKTMSYAPQFTQCDNAHDWANNKHAVAMYAPPPANPSVRYGDLPTENGFNHYFVGLHR